MATPSKTKIYLASRSPRRRELLKQIGVAFEVLVLREHSLRGSDVDESQLPGELPDDYVRRVSRAKVDSGWDRILGKPADQADAERMLRLLSGREHLVLTAVALKLDDRTELVASESRVRFCKLAEPEIQAYVESGEPTDKAGAYAIQGRAAAFVTELHGSYSGIMGLPLYETVQLIRKFHYE